MGHTIQTNVRVPESARQVLGDVARIVRENPEAVERLREWVQAEWSASAGAPTLERRVDALEREVAALKEGTPPARKPARSQPAQGEPEPSAREVLSADPETGEPWVIKRDYKSKFTEAGEAEVWRRIREGENVTSIARALGVTASAVSRRKKAQPQDE
jgi:DNA-binding NarL/FixJ family response regulator